MIIDVNSTPSYVLGDLLARYNSAQLDQAAEAMSLYLEEEGQALLNLFMEPETRMLASDATNLLRKMSEENLRRLIDLLDDHIGKIYADDKQLTGSDLLAEQVRAAHYRGEI